MLVKIVSWPQGSPGAQNNSPGPVFQAEFEFEGGPAESVAILPTESTESSRGSEGDLRPFIRKPGAGVENNRRRVFPPGLSSACALNTSTPACPPAWTFQLRQHEWGFQSQNGEDGVLLAILHHVDPDWRDAKAENMFVEFGVGDGTECNTAFLREAFGWRGVMFDARYASSTIGLHKTVVQPTNINQLFSEHHVPRYFSVLSVSASHLHTVLVYNSCGVDLYSPSQNGKHK